MLRERQDTLRDNIRYARMKLGLQVKDLAKIAGVGKTTISNFEASGNKLGEMALFKIAGALGVEPEDLEDPGFRLRFQPAGAAEPDPTPAANVLRESQNDEAARLICAFAKLTAAQQQAVLILVEGLAGQAAGGVVYATPKHKVT
jgi:transcriptional regulator with XRE-family HTH domain